MRTGAVLLAALLLGVAGGYGAGVALRPDPTRAEQRPVTASDPAYPVVAEDVLADDPRPAIDPGLELVEGHVGKGSQEVVVPVPAGWRRHPLGAGEAFWEPLPLPGQDDSARAPYIVRVQSLGVRRSRDQMRGARLAELPLDPRVSDLEVLDEDDSLDLLAASFVLTRAGESRGARKVTVIRWLTLGEGEEADVEIAWTGRLVDREGMTALLARMAQDLHRADEDQ